MAYLRTSIDGNKQFGGYLSVDGGKSVAIGDGDVYEIAAGQHLIQIHSTSDFERGQGKFQGRLNSLGGSFGGMGIIDSVLDHQVDKAIGDNWKFQVIVGEGQSIDVSVLTKGKKIISDPMYAVSDLDTEELSALKEHFDKIHEEELRIAMTPRRSVKMIVIGALLLFGSVNGFAQVFAAEGGVSANVSMLVVAILFLVAGGLLVGLGMKKKVR